MTGTFDPVMLERLRQAILRLPSMTRAVYLMSARDDLAYPEIARRLSVSPVEVERHLADALMRLYDEIYGEDEDSPDRAQSRRKHLAVHARQLAFEPDLPILREHS